jgi:hypothetical protein
MKSKKLPKKHRNNAFGWEMGEHIHAQILKVLKVSVMGVRYLSINSDELTSIHTHHWLLIHVYVVNNWACTPLL